MDWLAVVDVVAEASVLDAYDALVLAQVSRSCLPPARRACYRRFGGGRVEVHAPRHGLPCEKFFRY